MTALSYSDLSIDMAPSNGSTRHPGEVSAEDAIKDLLSDADWPQVKFLYDNLSILDSKSASLRQSNAVLAAVVAFLYTQTKPLSVKLMEFAVLLLVLVSSIFCMLVVRIMWIDSVPSKSRGVTALVDIRRRRTAVYRFAWWLTFVSIFGVIVVAVALLLTGPR